MIVFLWAAALSLAFSETLATNPAISTAESNLDCSAQAAWFAAAFSRSSSVDQILFEASKNSKVLLIGEDHSHKSAIAQYPQMILNLKQKGWRADCVFLEIDKRFQPQIDAYIAGKKTYEQTLRDAEIAVGYKPVPGLVFTPLKPASQTLLDFLKTQKIKVFAVDHQQDPTDVGGRNRVIAGLIRSYLRGECNRAFVPVGTNHLDETSLPNHPRHPIAPIQEILSKAGVAAATVIVESPKSLQAGFKMLCPEHNLTIPKRSFGIVPRSPAPISRRGDKDFKTPTWDWFQGLVIIP